MFLKQSTVSDRCERTTSPLSAFSKSSVIVHNGGQSGRSVWTTRFTFPSPNGSIAGTTGRMAESDFRPVLGTTLSVSLRHNAQEKRQVPLQSGDFLSTFSVISFSFFSCFMGESRVLFVDARRPSMILRNVIISSIFVQTDRLDANSLF